MEKSTKMSPIRLEKNDKKILIFDRVGEMSEFAIRKWGEAAESAIECSGRFTAALSGGQTPLPFYNRLAEQGEKLPWDKTHIFLTDERFVPQSDPDSNFSRIEKELLKKVAIPDANIHSVYFDNTAQNAAENYEKDIRQFFKLKEDQAPQFDLIILGIGEDGHTASLFPKHKALLDDKHLASAVLYSAVKNERVSLTLPVINNAKTIVFLISGKSKADVINEIIQEENSDLPAFLVRPNQGELFYLIDKEAGSKVN